MYAGRKVEEAPVGALFERPQHPYTRGLLGATPSAVRRRGGRLAEIAGSVPALSELPAGCAFQNRCPAVFDRCRAERPVLAPILPQQSAACFAAEEEASRHVAAVGP
jgi:oligopeptide/dipeptide ABC transporter ATP-binding protein